MVERGINGGSKENQNIAAEEPAGNMWKSQ